jgi:hypothetical protein
VTPKSIDNHMAEPLIPEWLRVHDALAYTRFGKSHFAELLSANEIKSFVLKQHRNALRGIRLVSRSSIDSFLARKAAEAEALDRKEAAQ